MKRKEFRFKRELYSIDGITNIPALIICSGHGYSYKTLCCKNCGEIFGVDNEYFFHNKTNVKEVSKNQSCPNCNINLENYLVNYPENIYYKGKLLVNKNDINRAAFENTEMIEIYSLT